MLTLASAALADEAPPPPFVAIPRINRPLTLEELLAGDPGERTAVVKGFVQRDLCEGAPASQETTIYLAYDDKNLYFGFVCLDREPQLVRAHVTRRSRWFSAGLSYEWGQQINFSPPEGTLPFLGQGNEIAFFMNVRPTTRLGVENTVLGNRFLTVNGDGNIFNNNIFRSKWNYESTPRLSLRVIGQYSNVLPSAEFSSLNHSKTLAGDVLVTYLLHPGTALYVGYSNRLENYQRDALYESALLERTRAGMLSTAAGLFVKFSYLYQF